MNESRRIRGVLIILLVASAIIRSVAAALIEFGYDEVYYWTYALFPDISHFDHPPMLGYLIQFFTVDLWLEDEFFIRLTAIVFGTVNTWIIFRIGKLIKDERAGLYAAFLYTTSFYGFIICGVFILPDAPQSLFWLLTLWFLLRSLPDRQCTKSSRTFLFVAGLTAGLAMLSKYHSVFLVTGALMFVLLYNRRWFSIRETWYAVLLIVILSLPILLWNISNDWISFTYHSERTSTETGPWLHPEFLLVEILGEFFYNNPVNVVIIIVSLIALGKGRKFLDPAYRNLILWISVPLIAAFWLFAMFARTLPHWTGPAFFGLILIASAWLSERSKMNYRLKLFPWPIQTALYLLVAVVVLAIGQIRFGLLPLAKWTGRDFTHDMAGWEQLGEKFKPVAEFDRAFMLIDPQAPIITFRWFPAANFQYYVARKSGNRVYAIGSLDRIHKYHWINQDNGNLPIGMDAYYIALSDDYTDPWSLFGDQFTVIQPSDTLVITRGDEIVRYAYIYRLIGLRDEMEFVPDDPVSEANQQVERMLYLQKQIRANPVWMNILRKRAEEQRMGIESMVILEATRIIEREKQVNADIRMLDSLANKISPDTIPEPLNYFPQ